VAKRNLSKNTFHLYSLFVISSSVNLYRTTRQTGGFRVSKRKHTQGVCFLLPYQAHRQKEQVVLGTPQKARRGRSNLRQAAFEEQRHTTIFCQSTKNQSPAMAPYLALRDGKNPLGSSTAKSKAQA